MLLSVAKDAARWLISIGLNVEGIDRNAELVATLAVGNYIANALVMARRRQSGSSRRTSPRVPLDWSDSKSPATDAHLDSIVYTVEAQQRLDDGIDCGSKDVGQLQPVVCTEELFTELLYGDAAAVIDLCDALETAGFDADSACAELGPIMGGRAFVALRHYDFPLGTRLIRTLAQLRLESDTVREALLYIRTQQRSDGSIGYINPLGRVSERKQLQFYVRSTVSCLWALYEVLFSKRVVCRLAKTNSASRPAISEISV